MSGTCPCAAVRRAAPVAECSPCPAAGERAGEGSGQGRGCSPGRALGSPVSDTGGGCLRSRGGLRARTAACAEVPVRAHPGTVGRPLPLPRRERGKVCPGAGAWGEHFPAQGKIELVGKIPRSPERSPSSRPLSLQLEICGCRKWTRTVPASPFLPFWQPNAGRSLGGTGGTGPAAAVLRTGKFHRRGIGKID